MLGNVRSDNSISIQNGHTECQFEKLKSWRFEGTNTTTKGEVKPPDEAPLKLASPMLA